MNRIVLIGNGFDLAHGLPTCYQDFIDFYWKLFSENIFKGNSMFRHETDMAKFEFNPTSTTITFTDPIPPTSTFNELIQRIDRYKDAYKQYYGHDGGIKLTFKSEFFKAINDKLGERKWVDIENEYYIALKYYCQQIGGPITPTTLNQELKSIEKHLAEYLLKIQDEKITATLFNKDIAHKILAPFDLRDISTRGQDLFLDYLYFMVSEMPNGLCTGEIEEIMNNHPEYQIGNTREEAYREMIYDMLGKGELDDYIFPDRTLLLNFNYTNTAEKLYSQTAANDLESESIHIHGELNNPDNPIIFGYGDEMDEHYKKIVDCNDNDYLLNIKSIRYLETDNYRKLLSFIDSAPYQIYIMGHSCGNSDRTLLNTLFEHENCISIKPYYYQKEDGSDNYIDIIQNIHRNFKDMTLMRDKVVNKKYCEPLPQNKSI